MANPILHTATKHVAVSFHFVRDKVADGSLKIQHIPTKEQLADILTKPIPRDHFCNLRNTLMRVPPISLRGVLEIINNRVIYLVSLEITNYLLVLISR